jgi:2'-5' RNA ligase
MDLQQTAADLKLVDPNIMHLTLRFLGEIPELTVEKVKEIMRSVHFSEFQTSFKGVGAFPNLNRINVVWIGITRGQDQLNGIFHQIEPNLRQIGLAPDNKGFSPHLTIARVKSGRNIGTLADVVTKSSDLEFGTMAVKCVRLKKSTLTSKGPIYSTLHEMQAT